MIMTYICIMGKSLLQLNPLKENDFDSDYWLGFLASDGSLYKNEIKLELQNADKEHIVKFSSFFKGIIPRSRYKPQFKKVMHLASFADKTIADKLRSLGITNNKSLTLEYNGKITWSFIRGVFDGDGCISLRKGKYDNVLGRGMFYSSSFKFINQINNFLLLNGFNTKIKNYDNRTKNPFYSIWICKKEDLIKLRNLMYKDGDFYLTRKKEKFDKLK